MQWLSDPTLQQRSHAEVNKGEASHSLRRAVFFHRQGGIRDRTFENLSFRASGLSLLTAAIVHWNRVYLERAVPYLREQGVRIPDDLLASRTSSTMRLSRNFTSSAGISGQHDQKFAPAGRGGAEGNRTPDLLNAIQALSQLSYGPGRRSL